MATLDTLGVSSIALKGTGTTYNRLSRFFTTKAEAEAALTSGGWVPVEGVLNACITGDDGVQVYDFATSALLSSDASARAYTDTKLADLIGGAPDALNTLSELASALGSASAITDLVSSVSTESTARQDADTALDTRLTAAETTITDLALKAPIASPSFTGTANFEELHIDNDGSNYGLTLNRISNTQFDIATVNPGSGYNLQIKNSNGSDAKVIVYSDLFWVRNLGGNNGNGEVKIDGTLTALGDVNVTGNVTSASGVFVQAHGSFDGSTAGSFDFANDGIASHNISGVTRTDTGKYTVAFTSAFASAAYTVVAQAGDQDYSGVGASPRSVCIVNRTAGSFDIVVERTDDAVNDDNGYVAFMVMGTLA